MAVVHVYGYGIGYGYGVGYSYGVELWLCRRVMAMLGCMVQGYGYSYGIWLWVWVRAMV